MKKHTTHYDDCGCLTARYKVAINGLEAIKRHQEQEIICSGCYNAKTGLCLLTTGQILNKTFETLKKMEESHD